ncbi:MAG: HAD hydrolase-like protein [bacterium]|nr:HAD hydrolase-like protein [bacterium]
MHILGTRTDLIILDVDGVILDILAGLKKNLEITAEHFKLNPAPIAQSLTDIASGKTRIKGNARDSTRMLWPHVSERQISEFVEHFYEVEREHPYPLIPGSKETLWFFHHRGIPLALATNNPKDVLDWRLEDAGIDASWFAAITTKDDKYFKPHPKTFDPIFERIAVPRHNAIYIGDLQIDWDTARRTGVTFVAVLSGGVPRHAFVAEGVPDTHILPVLSHILDHIED